MLIFHVHSVFTQFHRHKLLPRIDRSAASFCRIEFQCQWICALLSFYPAPGALSEHWNRIALEIKRMQRSQSGNCKQSKAICLQKEAANQPDRCTINVEKYLENLNIWYSHRPERNNKVNILCAQSELFLSPFYFSFSFVFFHSCASKMLWLKEMAAVMSWLLSMILSCSR